MNDIGPRLAIAGKGGAGKSTIAGTLARLLAREDRRVLALDSDFMPGLTISLGATQPEPPPLMAAAVQDDEGRWRLRPGIGPARAIARYSTEAPDGVRLLGPGKFGPDGLRPIMPAVQAFYRVIHALDRPRSLRSWAILGDLSAGPRQAAFDWAPYAETFVLVVEPTWKSVLTARTLAGLARKRGRAVVAVANKVRDAADVREVERRLGEDVLAAVPADDAVREAERAGAALLDRAPDAPAVRAIGVLAERILEGYARNA